MLVQVFVFAAMYTLGQIIAKREYQLCVFLRTESVGFLWKKRDRMPPEVRDQGDLYTTGIVHTPYFLYTSSNQNNANKINQRILQLFSRAQLSNSMWCCYDRGVPKRLKGVLSRDKMAQAKPRCG
ncbi:hypothetical protein V2G26_004495 [Clonostachys chloroleuca]